MILDALAQLADGQSTTFSAASSSVIDTLAKGDSYEGAWFVAMVDTSFTAGLGAPTTSFLLETSGVEAFTSDVNTLITTTATLVAGLTAGTFFKVRIPPGAKRYIRGYKSVTNYAAASIALGVSVYSMFITKDVEIPVESPNVLA